MTTSGRLGFPMLAPGQIAKECLHNEALERLDFLVAAAVLEVGRNEPPASASPGDCYILGDEPTGAWIGHPAALASYTESGWRFASAIAGLSVLDRQSGCIALFDGTSWNIGDVRAKKISVGGDQVVGGRRPAIPDHPSDATVNAILVALRAHGMIAI